MGYSPAITQLLSAPPVVFAVITALAVSWTSDKIHMRSPAIVLQCLIGITGLMITAYHSNDGVRYFGLFLGQAGCQGNVPAILAYQANNLRMQSKRAVSSALQIGFGSIGGIIASTVFFEHEAPYYRTGLWITASLQFFIISIVACMTVFFIAMNKKVDNGTLKHPVEGLVGFKYTL
jgi:MFS family permease